jgi:Mnd1 HTH domain
MKELEKLGAKAGVVEKTVKDIVEILISEGKVECEKIGSGNYYWSFPSKAFINIKNRADQLISQAEAEKATIKALEAKLAGLTAAKKDSVS